MRSLHLARFERLLHRRKVVEIAAGILDLAPAQLDLALHADARTPRAVRPRVGFGMCSSDQSCALSSSIPVGFAGFLVLQDFAAERSSACSLSILAIRSAALFAIAAWPSARVRKTGLSGAILSRSCAGRELRRFPEVSIQPRPVIHLPGSVFATRSFTFARKSSSVLVPSRFKRHLALADPENVAMRIGQARHDGFPGEIDRLRFRRLIFFRVRVRADENNRVILHRDRFGVRLAFVHRVNVAVDENDLSIFGSAATAKAKPNAKKKKNSRIFIGRIIRESRARGRARSASTRNRVNSFSFIHFAY